MSSGLRREQDATESAPPRARKVLLFTRDATRLAPAVLVARTSSFWT